MEQTAPTNKGGDTQRVGEKQETKCIYVWMTLTPGRQLTIDLTCTSAHEKMISDRGHVLENKMGTYKNKLKKEKEKNWKRKNKLINKNQREYFSNNTISLKSWFSTISFPNFPGHPISPERALNLESEGPVKA